MKTEELINSLAHDTVMVKPLQKPSRLVFFLTGILFIYALVIGLSLGLRADLAVQLHRPFFIAETLLLLSIILSSLFAVILLLYPDRYQRNGVLYFPVYSLCAFILVLAVQACLPPDTRMILPVVKVHSMECTICIATVAMIPSAFMFVFLRRGASVYPFLSGIYAVLLSAGIGCFMLRLAEANDSLLHLTLWHYIPTLFFAAIGASIGKIFLKW